MNSTCPECGHELTLEEQVARLEKKVATLESELSTEKMWRKIAYIPYVPQTTGDPAPDYWLGKTICGTSSIPNGGWN